MKAIEGNGIITSASTRGKLDGLRLSLITPELSEEEMAEILKLVNINIRFLLNPLDIKNAPVYKIDKELETKTPGQRLRGTLYVYWEQSGSKGDFNDFYRKNMEKFINLVKDFLA